MTSESVLVYVRAAYTLPRVSSAASMFTLADRSLMGTVFFCPLGAHFALLKSMNGIEDSSMLIMRLPSSSKGSIMLAYCWRSTRDLSVLAK